MTRIRQMQRTPRKSGLLTADIYKNAGVHQLNPAEDLLVSTDASGARFYALNIPRAKQHGGRTRDSSKTRYCNKQVGRLLELLIESNRALKNDPKIADGEWPLFICRSKGDLPDLPYHMPSQRLGIQLKNTLGRITGLKSDAGLPVGGGSAS
jgi:hypothetical protein